MIRQTNDYIKNLREAHQHTRGRFVFRIRLSTPTYQTETIGQKVHRWQTKSGTQMDRKLKSEERSRVYSLVSLGHHAKVIPEKLTAV